jgi:hypothetical protein
VAYGEQLLVLEPILVPKLKRLYNYLAIFEVKSSVLIGVDKVNAKVLCSVELN